MTAAEVNWQRRTRAKARLKGRCPECRGKRAVDPGFKWCRPCLDRKQLRKKILRGTAVDPRSFLECCQAFGRHRGACREGWMRRAA